MQALSTKSSSGSMKQLLYFYCTVFCTSVKIEKACNAPLLQGGLIVVVGNHQSTRIDLPERFESYLYKDEKSRTTYGKI